MSNQKYDLIVVGAGILGTFHAYHALRKGLRVLHLEKDNYPQGSTVRNFGQIVPSGMAGEWFDYGVRGLEIYQSIQREMEIAIRNNGSIYIASDDDETQLIHELGAHYDNVGYEYEIWSQQQIQQKYPMFNTSYPKEAIVFKQELSAEPDLMVMKIQEYLKAKFSNYTLHYNSAVIACEEKGQTVQLLTSSGTRYEGEKVVICNGYEFKLLFRDLFEDAGLKVSKLQMMRTRPMPELNMPGNILTGLTIRRYESFERNCPSFHHIAVPAHYEELRSWGIHILFKQAVDGSIIVGDSHEYASGSQIDDLGFSLNNTINRLMLDEANRIMPMNESMIQSTWVGCYSQHEKEILEIDVSNRVHIRTGIGGKGMTASAGYAEKSLNCLF